MQIALPADITLRGKVAECRLPWKTEVNPNARHRETCFSWNRLSKFNRKGKLKFFTVFYCLGYFISVTVSLRKHPFLLRSTPLGTFRMLSQANCDAYKITTVRNSLTYLNNKVWSLHVTKTGVTCKGFSGIWLISGGRARFSFHHILLYGTVV